MAISGKGGGEGNGRAAVYEKSAKQLEKAAKACRVQKGGVECAILDLAASVVKNAPAIADALTKRGRNGSLGEAPERALAAAAEIAVEATRVGAPAPKTVPEAASPTSVSGASEVAEPPAVLNAVAEPASGPAIAAKEPTNDRG
jgi:hypothetical protein